MCVTQEEHFTTCPSQNSMPFGYVVVPHECTKTLKRFDAMATFAPATPTQRCEKHENHHLQKFTKNPILIGFPQFKHIRDPRQLFYNIRHQNEFFEFFEYFRKFSDQGYVFEKIKISKKLSLVLDMVKQLSGIINM